MKTPAGAPLFLPPLSDAKLREKNLLELEKFCLFVVILMFIVTILILAQFAC
jgi:hypothetical protein